MTDPEWIPLDVIVETNRDIVAETGEAFTVLPGRDLAGALARPVNAWLYRGEEEIPRLAVILLIAVASCHYFEQGNKRTGFYAAMMFLEVNGFDYVGPDEEELADLIIAVLKRERDIEEIHQIFMENSVPAVDVEQEF